MFCYGRLHFKKQVILILAESALASGWLLHSQDYASISIGCSSSIHFPGWYPAVETMVAILSVCFHKQG